MNAKLVVEQFGRHDRHEGNFTFIPATVGLEGVWLRGRIRSSNNGSDVDMIVLERIGE